MSHGNPFPCECLNNFVNEPGSFELGILSAFAAPDTMVPPYPIMNGLDFVPTCSFVPMQSMGPDRRDLTDISPERREDVPLGFETPNPSLPNDDAAHPTGPKSVKPKRPRGKNDPADRRLRNAKSARESRGRLTSAINTAWDPIQDHDAKRRRPFPSRVVKMQSVNAYNQQLYREIDEISKWVPSHETQHSSVSSPLEKLKLVKRHVISMSLARRNSPPLGNVLNSVSIWT